MDAAGAPAAAALLRPPPDFAATALASGGTLSTLKAARFRIKTFAHTRCEEGTRDGWGGTRGGTSVAQPHDAVEGVITHFVLRKALLEKVPPATRALREGTAALAALVIVAVIHGCCCFIILVRPEVVIVVVTLRVVAVPALLACQRRSHGSCTAGLRCGRQRALVVADADPLRERRRLVT